jgi:hypothetical protein
MRLKKHLEQGEIALCIAHVHRAQPRRTSGLSQANVLHLLRRLSDGCKAGVLEQSTHARKTAYSIDLTQGKP